MTSRCQDTDDYLNELHERAYVGDAVAAGALANLQTACYKGQPSPARTIKEPNHETAQGAE